MSGQTLQKVQRIIDTSCVVRDRLDEESRTKPLAYGSIKVQQLAEILGGRAREPYWVGEGWNDDPGSGEDALDPKGVARALETGARKNTKVRAWGFVINIPKGVSLLAAFDPEIKQWLDGVMTRMQEEYMRVLEQGSVVRFGDGGCKPSIPVSGLKGWAVKHAASAGGDPHYHVHLLVSATAHTMDGRRGQIDGNKLLNETAKIADGSARRILTREMEKLGLGFGLDGEVVGIDKDVIERASTARNAIEAIRTYFATYNTPISDEQAWHHWRQIAEGKADKALPQTLIEQIRASRGEKLGGEAIEHAMDEAISDPERASALSSWLATKYNISNWQETSQKARDAWASYPQFDDVTRVIALMATLPTAPKPEAVAGLCARFADDEHRNELMERVGADPRVLVGARRWVLKAQLDVEELITQRSEKLLSFSSRGNENPDKGIDELLSNSNDLPLVVIQGVAGGGKSSALAAANGLWKANGVTVWATARNRLTATDTGLISGADKSHSLSTFALRKRITLSDPNTPKPGDVLVVDEFGLLDHGDVEMILSLAERGVKVKALGDSYQIQPIDGSTSARLVMDLARKHAMANLDESRRCEAWKALHDSLRRVVVGEAEPKDVLGLLDIRSASSAADAAEIVSDHPGAEIAVQSNELRCRVAEALPRPEMQMLRGTDIPNITMLRDGIAGWVGDQVVVRRNARGTLTSGNLGEVTNGERGQIAHIGPRGVVVDINGKHITLSRDTSKESLALGGVHTGDSAQGQTWERAVVVLTGTETREWLYSALTRGRNTPVIVVLSDEDEPAQSVVEKVLSREGISKTVEEMCKTDATLAESVRKAREGDLGGGDDGGGLTDSSDRATDAELKPKESEVSEPELVKEPKLKAFVGNSGKIFLPWEDGFKAHDPSVLKEMLTFAERRKEVVLIGHKPELRTEAELCAAEAKIADELKRWAAASKPKVFTREERLEIIKEWEEAGEDVAAKSTAGLKVRHVNWTDEENVIKARQMKEAQHRAEQVSKALAECREASAKLLEGLTPEEIELVYLVREQYLADTENHGSDRGSGTSHSSREEARPSNGYGYGKHS